MRHPLRLNDGRIVVADGGSGEIRVFGPAGRHLHTWGGQGEGPGEFAFPTRIGPWPGDTLAVWDRRLRGLSLLAPAGSFVRTLDVTLVSRGGLLDWIGSFADPVSVFTHQDKDLSSAGGGPPSSRMARPRWGGGPAPGRVETPPGLTLLQIGRDFVLGHRTDELDVEHIQSWLLARPPA